MTIPSRPALCHLCHHHKPGSDPAKRHVLQVCVAFPRQIPQSILHEGFDHRQPLYNEPVTFQPAQGVTVADVNEWEQRVLEIEKRHLFDLLDALECADADAVRSESIDDPARMSESEFLEWTAHGLRTGRNPPGRT